MSSAEVKEVLTTILGSLPEILADGPGTISTARVLRHLAQAWPAPAEEHDLNALCRKIHVGRKVLAAYRDDWKRGPTQEILPRPFWPLLVAVLLAYSEPGDEVEARGLALKCLNAALAATALAERQGYAEDLADLADWSRRRLLAVEVPEGPSP